MRRRKPKLTIRGRLALVYGGLFLLAGVVLLGVIYVLVSYQLPAAPGTEALEGGSLASTASTKASAPSSGFFPCRGSARSKRFVGL